MTEHKPLLIIIAGPNGSGKTTITSRILKHEWLEDCEYINPDDIAQNTFGDWNSDIAVKQAAQYASELREQYLKERKSLIFETVFSSDDKVNYVKRAIEAGYFIRIFFVATESPIINAARVANRVLNGGHDVPISKIITRYYKSIYNICTVAKYADRVYFYDNTQNGEAAKILFRIADGKIAKQYATNLPIWAERIKENIEFITQ